MAKNKENELGNIIKEARDKRGLTQRELGEYINFNYSEICRIENGKRKKPNNLILQAIANELDLSAIDLLKLAGYSDFEINMLNTKSTKDYEDQLEEYRVFYFNVLDDIEERRKRTRSNRGLISELIYDIENNKDTSKEEIVKRLKEIMELSKDNLLKFDREKMPKTTNKLLKFDTKSNVKVDTMTGGFVEEKDKK